MASIRFMELRSFKQRSSSRSLNLRFAINMHFLAQSVLQTVSQTFSSLECMFIIKRYFGSVSTRSSETAKQNAYGRQLFPAHNSIHFFGDVYKYVSVWHFYIGIFKDEISVHGPVQRTFAGFDLKSVRVMNY